MEHTMLSFQKKKNLSVVQFVQYPVDSFNYISSNIAIKNNFIEVMEIGDSPSVDRVMVINNSQMYVFFSAGDILVGAKQNRLVNTSIMIPPNTNIEIPVTCVEEGRWEETSEKFYNSDLTAPTVLNSKVHREVTKNLIKENKYSSDQQEVWSDIEIIFNKKRVTSSTNNLAELINKESKKVNNDVDKFSADKNANGMAVFSGFELIRLEIFNRKDIYQEYFPKVIESVTFDYGESTQEKFVDKDFAFTNVNEFFSSIQTMTHFVFPSLGVGEQKRYEHEKFTGFTLRYLDHMIHTSFIETKQVNQQEDLPF